MTTTTRAARDFFQLLASLFIQSADENVNRRGLPLVAICACDSEPPNEAPQRESMSSANNNSGRMAVPERGPRRKFDDYAPRWINQF